MYVKAIVTAKHSNCLFVSVLVVGSLSLLFLGSVCEGMTHVDRTPQIVDDYPKHPK